MSCVSGSQNLENDTTHGQTGSTTHRSRPLADADQSGKRKLNGEVARHARHPRSILARMSRVSGASTRISGRCYEETAPVEFRIKYPGGEPQCVVRMDSSFNASGGMMQCSAGNRVFQHFTVIRKVNAVLR